MSSSSTVRIEKQVNEDEIPIYILHLEGSPNSTLTNYENKLNFQFISDFMKSLDEIEKDAKGGPAAMITIGKGKHYSDGLDLSQVLEFTTLEQRIKFFKAVEFLFLRILTFPMITIAAVNGHAFAGGMLLALAHDYRIGNAEKGFWCMSEIDIGAALTPGFSALLNVKMPPSIRSHMMITGDRFNSADMVKHSVVVSVAKGEAEVLKESMKLATKYASKAKLAMRDIKEDLWRPAVDELRHGSGDRSKL
jgi:enoyl-CoA hydratase/carnithine racemase